MAFNCATAEAGFTLQIFPHGKGSRGASFSGFIEPCVPRSLRPQFIRAPSISLVPNESEQALAVYIKRVIRNGERQFMASVGSGPSRIRKTFPLETTALAWEATEMARRRSLTPVPQEFAKPTSVQSSELVGSLVAAFLRCDSQCQQLLASLAVRLSNVSG